MKLLYFLSFCFLGLLATAQQHHIFSQLSATGQGTVVIEQDERLKTYVLDFINKKENDGGLNGYRVQLYFGSGHNARESANKIRNQFVAQFPDVPAKVIFQEPNFKVRVGDYRTRSEALFLIKQMEGSFSGAYIVKDFIDYPQL